MGKLSVDKLKRYNLGEYKHKIINITDVWYIGEPILIMGNYLGKLVILYNLGTKRCIKSNLPETIWAMCNIDKGNAKKLLKGKCGIGDIYKSSEKVYKIIVSSERGTLTNDYGKLSLLSDKMFKDIKLTNMVINFIDITKIDIDKIVVQG